MKVSSHQDIRREKIQKKRASIAKQYLGGGGGGLGG